MSPRSGLVWLVAGVAVSALLLASWRPLAVGWRCYELWSAGERATAEVVRRLDPPLLALRVVSGGASGAACLARTSVAHHAGLAPGDRLPVVLRADRRGDCELEATLVNSLWLLGGTSAAVLFTGLLILSLAAWLARALGRPPELTTRLDLPEPPDCPRCGKRMEEGALVPLAGIHWRAPEQPTGLAHALSGLPGTVGWRGRPRLQAWRCEACAVATLAYGRPD